MTTEIKEILKDINDKIKFKKDERAIYQNAYPELKKIVDIK